MFFISSSYLRRFITVKEIKQYFPDMSPEEIKAIPSTEIHRFVCQYYQKQVPAGKEFYLSPFSIKKGANIYGIIFGSGSLLGLEKFLKVCWNKDRISGDANYDIDKDIVRNGETLFPAMNVSKKVDGFRTRLTEFLQEFKSNNELYKFTLEYGCLPSHTKEILTILQNEGRLLSRPSDIRKKSFYLSWKHYRDQCVRVEFCLKK